MDNVPTKYYTVYEHNMFSKSRISTEVYYLNFIAHVFFTATMQSSPFNKLFFGVRFCRR